MSAVPPTERPVLLDRARHRGLRVRPATDFAFTRSCTVLPVAAVEFGDAMKEFAIVFTRGDDGVPHAGVMLGLRPDENLFLDGKGQWDAACIPAVIRRHPFVLARLDGGPLGVCIDEASPLVGRDAGEPLFGDDGRNTPWLDQAVEFLGRWHTAHEQTEAFCRRIDTLGLLQPLQAQADLVDGRRFTVAGFHVVDEQRLAALDDAQVLALFRAGDLHLVSMHLASLSNMRRLVDRMARQRPAQMPSAPLPR